MKRLIKFNYKMILPFQVPDSHGNLAHDRYYKFDFVFKNCSAGTIEELDLVINFNEPAKIVKHFAGDKKLVVERANNNLRLIRRTFKKGNTINVDCFVSELELSSKTLFQIKPADEQLKLSKTFFLKVKRVQNPLVGYLRKNIASLWSFIRKHATEVGFGIIITAVLTPIFANIGILSKEKPDSQPRVDTVKSLNSNKAEPSDSRIRQ